ncbi:MAG: Smr/MutS family protein [Spirochaetales bacterium]|nr:Smr/MutS family protein [Spirochaetales bacterium]
MDFHKILDEWEKNKNKNNQIHMDNYLDKYLPDNASIQEKELQQKDKFPGEERAKRLRMKPQKTLDLHGMMVKDACKAVDRFLFECKKAGIKKVLIIHGKGRHSRQLYTLAKKIREYIQTNPLTGECGIAEKEFGGSGALWVFIR